MSAFNHLNPEKVARALSLTGGGVRGAFTAKVLAELESRVGGSLSTHFDVFVGTSVGGIIALGLACGMSGTEICESIVSNLQRIFGKPAELNPFGLRVARYRPDDLACCFTRIFGAHSKLPIRSLKKNVIVPSIDALDNKSILFSNVERIGDTLCRDAALIDVALATSAAPTYFPPHPIGDRIYLDGGIASNNPDIEALRFCVTSLARPIESCVLLSIGSGQNRFKIMNSRSRPGTLVWIAKHRLIDRIFSLQESKSSELVEDLLRERYVRLDTRFERSIALDDYREKAILELIQRARECVEEQWKKNPTRIASAIQ